MESSAKVSPASRVGGKAGHELLSRFKLSEDTVISAIPYFLLVVLFGLLSALQPASLSGVHIVRIVNISMPLMLVSIGQLIVVLTGGMDLSVGGVFSLTSAIMTASIATGLHVGPVVAVLVALGWIPGLVNGLLITYAHVKPFIVTLATWFIFGGLALVVLPVSGGVIEASLAVLSRGVVARIPAPAWVLVGVSLFGIWLLRTRLGLEIKSIGSNREAAFHAGVNTRRVEIAAYCLSSFFAVLGGIFFSAQVLSGDPKVGDGYILSSFAVVVVGGARLSGGRGSIIGTAVGALVIAYLQSVTYALRLSAQYAQILQGLLLIFSVAAQFFVHAAFRRQRED